MPRTELRTWLRTSRACGVSGWFAHLRARRVRGGSAHHRPPAAYTLGVQLRTLQLRLYVQRRSCLLVPHSTGTPRAAGQAGSPPRRELVTRQHRGLWSITTKWLSLPSSTVISYSHWAGGQPVAKQPGVTQQLRASRSCAGQAAGPRVHPQAGSQVMSAPCAGPSERLGDSPPSFTCMGVSCSKAWFFSSQQRGVSFVSVDSQPWKRPQATIFLHFGQLGMGLTENPALKSPVAGRKQHCINCRN